MESDQCYCLYKGADHAYYNQAMPCMHIQSKSVVLNYSTKVITKYNIFLTLNNLKVNQIIIFWIFTLQQPKYYLK